MSNKKKNEIIEEQRKAREEFLKLKKMQQGEIDAGPNPSEVAVVPKTFKEKLDNFWYQYKFRVIAIIFAAVVIIVSVAQCVSRPKYDLKIVYFAYTPAFDDQLNLVEAYFEEFTSDLNEDGEVKVQVINCSFSDNDSNSQYKNSTLMKVQSIITAEQNTMLYITDEKADKYFDGLSVDVNIFNGEPIRLDSEFYEKTVWEGITLPEGLGISCRNISDTLLEDSAEAQKTVEESKKILDKLAK